LKYQIIKSADGEVIAYGPDNGMYEPSLKEGDFVVIENEDVAKVIIETYHNKVIAEINATKLAKAAAKAQLLKRLGITDAEAKLLFD